MSSQDFATLLTILVAASLLLWVVAPLLRDGSDKRGGMDDLALERERALLSSLHDLYRERETGKVSEGDFPSIERRMLLELAKLYAAAKVDPAGGEAQAATAEPPATAEPVAESSSAFCTQCGAKQTADHRFCGQCGHAFDVSQPALASQQG